MTYKLIQSILPDGTTDINTVCLVKENKFIPFDNANTDYQEYLEWIAEGNTPEPADEVTE